MAAQDSGEPFKRFVIEEVFKIYDVSDAEIDSSCIDGVYDAAVHLTVVKSRGRNQTCRSVCESAGDRLGQPQSFKVAETNAQISLIRTPGDVHLPHSLV